jgi:aspartokinase
LGNTLETKAAYWEPRIKTYGFQRMTGLSLVEMTVPRAGIESLGAAFCRLADAGVGFHLVFSRTSFRGLEVSLLVTAQWAKVIEEHMQKLVEGADKVVGRTSPAEMVFFQGPHFGDRYGILDAAVRGLAARGIGMKATVCSGSCIYIVLPEGKSDEAVLALSEVFEIPRAASHKRSSPAG